MFNSLIIQASKIFYKGLLIWRPEVKEKLVYLTFDDGPDVRTTKKILEILKENEIKATFFCLGEKAEKQPALLQQIIDDGHRIGAHGFKHLNGWLTPLKKYLSNAFLSGSILNTELFRPPYGKITVCQAKHISKQYKIVMWTVMSKDYCRKVSPQKCLQIVTRKIRPGDIFVFHDSQGAAENCIYALPLFIKQAKKLGFKFDLL